MVDTFSGIYRSMGEILAYVCALIGELFDNSRCTRALIVKAQLVIQHSHMSLSLVVTSADDVM